MCLWVGGECTEERINLTLISSFSGGRGGGGQRASERERGAKTETDRERQRERDRQTGRQRQREREREGEIKKNSTLRQRLTFKDFSCSLAPFWSLLSVYAH